VLAINNSIFLRDNNGAGTRPSRHEEIVPQTVTQFLKGERLRNFETPHLFAFTPEVETVGSTVHSRMFAPAMGIAEDPATGAASGPLGCYLVRHARATSDRSMEIISEQGFEMGRPSFIQITIEHKGEHITGVQVGGQCHFMGEGFIELP
jgi:trans-2,3-dihydro-3-hydroxyanthranilate isomerase